MYACVCVSRARAFRPCWPCRLSVCVCVCVWVRGCASFFGAQKAQRTLKDTWPALTATPTTAARQRLCARVRICVEDSLSGVKQQQQQQRCAALRSATAGCTGTGTDSNSCFLLSVGNAQLLRCDSGQRRLQRSAVQIRKTDNRST